MGAGSQFVNDMTYGLFYTVVGDPSNIDNQAYQQGREVGRAGTILVGSTETVIGAVAVGAGLSSIAPTIGGGLAAALPTGGTSLVVAGVAIPVEAVVILGGSVVAGHGIGTIAYIKGNPFGSSPGLRRLSASDIKMLQEAGYDIHELKGGDNASLYDLFKDDDGNIFQKPKDGSGPGEDLRINLNNLFEDY